MLCVVLGQQLATWGWHHDCQIEVFCDEVSVKDVFREMDGRAAGVSVRARAHSCYMEGNPLDGWCW